MFGILNVYKPCGMTSHDVVNILRKILKIKQIGHTGTLDPFAEGVLPVCVGRAARLIEYLPDEKEYLAEVQFGSATNTYDTEGQITSTSNKKVNRKEVETALKNFEGEILQLPPIYSAIKVNGKKLYEYARNGEDVEISPRKVTIYNIELKEFNEETQTAKILISCSKGTYIRSLANDLGETLGSFGHLTRLIRTKAGAFPVENAIELPITRLKNNGNEYSRKFTINDGAEEIIKNSLINPILVLPQEKMEITAEERERISHGMAINKKQNRIKSGDFIILVYNNHVDAIGQFDGEKIKVKKVFL